MVKLVDKEEELTRRIMVFGPPKAGKTQLVGHLAERFNLHWFDLESGSNTLMKMPKDLKSKVELFTVPDTKDTPTAFATCLKVMKGGSHSICRKHGKVACVVCKKDAPTEFDTFNLGSLGTEDCLVFDSITQVVNSVRAIICAGKPDDYKLLQDDWGQMGNLMDMFLSYIQAARHTNVVCISHEMMVPTVDKSEKIVPTAGTRNFSRNSAKYFDDIVYAAVENGKHTFSSSSTYRAKILTGSRSGVALEKSKDGARLLDLWDKQSSDAA